MNSLRFLSLLLCIFLAKGELDSRVDFIENVDQFNDGRIISGWPAAAGQFPHQVHLVMSGTSGSASCGGSLISTRHVLTAAHCLTGMTSVRVRVGSISLSAGTVLESRSFIIHSGYNSNNLNNDLGIITLPSAVTLSSTVQVIRLPRSSEVSLTHAGKVATASGFGRTTNTGSISQTLNYVNLTVITNTVCAQTYGSIIIGSTICCRGIQSTAQSTCSGDSGGPLIVRDTDGLYTQIGVVSFVSSAGCSSGAPSGYVRSGNFLSWISTNTGIAIRP